MESNASESPSASSPNGLKIFTRPKRSRTTLNEIDHPYASDQSSRTPSLDIRPSTSHGSSVAPTGLAKFIPGAKRRQRRKTKGANNESLIDLNSEISGESRVSLPALEVNGERHRPITDPSPLMDDPEFGAGPPTAPHKLHADGPRTSPLITVSDPSIREEHHDTQGGSSAANSETASDNLNLAILRSTAVGVPAHSPTKESVGSSTGRKLRSAFNPRSPNRSSNTSPDRESSKSSGSNAGKGFLGSAVRTTSFSSKKNKKSPEDIPPLPAPPKLPEDTVSKNNRHLPPLDTTPSTPPLGHKPLPVKTTVTPPTPTNPRLQENNAELVHSPESMTNPSSLPPNAVLSPSGNMISHRRVRSASAAHPPSKLSSSMTIPSTPSIDEKSTTPGSRNGQGNSAGGGFFSSMFSAAQNAASTLSIGLNQGRARNASDPGEAEKQPTPDQPENRSRSSSVRDTEVEEKKEQAIDTLGMGNLDFSHLGIDPSAGNQVTTPDGVVFTKADQGHRSRGSTVSERDELAARIEDLRAARAVSMAYEKTPHSASFPASIAEDNQLDSRASAPFSGLGKGGSGGERTPPTASIVDGDISERVMRSGSLRSRRGIRRKRGSSAATSTTIGTIGAALGMPGAHLSTPRLTGFAVASKKRNRDFHQLFRSVPEDDYLIEDYSCALQREIILAGRIYISEGHICFSSNILGWVTTLVYDEDEEGGVAGIMENVDSLATSDISEPRKRVARKPSTMLVSTGISSQAVSVAAGDESKTGTKSGTSTDVSAQFPGPKTHAPTEFTDPSGRYDKVVKDETIPAPLGQVYSLVFGAASTSFISKFLVEYEKVLDLQFEGDKKGLTEENKTRSYTYIKPLNSSIGPKQTKCISVEQLDFFDLEKAVLVTLTTQTPDVPNGNVFSVKTKYLFTWAPGNSTRFLMSCVVEWTGRSWIKGGTKFVIGPIEKGANDGQLGYGTNLIKALKAGIAPKARKLTPKGTTKSKIKRTKTTTSELDASNGGAYKADRAGATSWGLFEPFRGPLSPIVDIFKPFWSSNVAAVLLCSLLLMMWLRTPPTSSIRPHGIAPHHLSVPERLLAYDELWAKEESDLWDWLEDRVGMDGLAIPAAGIENGNSKQRRKRVHKDAEARLRDERMSEREIVDAIRVTQKRLETLQQVIDRRKLDRQRGESEDRAAKN
ncbi:GRAM domain-containing protein [Coccidioides immitis H538.4]|uniref:GRAM domain-containing protein n=1 Tax=Coccidioides immitis H538.4 TaxID=396776 RepID=A0A0J8RIT7_COCIT|nr:GRAM domain-containing protein [Coccidioides immitis H538.4]